MNLPARKTRRSGGTTSRPIRTALLLLVMTGLLGCAGSGEIRHDETGGSLLFIGFDTQGKYLSRLGHYFVLHFRNEAGGEQEVVVRPRANDNHMTVSELGPGNWTLESFAQRNRPGVEGFASTSLRRRAADIAFDLTDGQAAMLGWQLVVTHGEDRYGLTTAEPAFVPLDDSVKGAIERRMADLGEDWQRAESPTGERPEPERSPSIFETLEQLFGNQAQ